MKTVPRWHSVMTPLNFLSLRIAGGALLAGQVTTAMVLLVLAGVVQIATWWRGDRALAASGSDIASATRLGDKSSVRAFEPPHTGSNYLLREFVYQIGRKHALKLRVIAIALMVLLPLLLLLSPVFHHLAAALAVLSHAAGVLTSRWLFFAQAEHVVGIYYGKR